MLVTAMCGPALARVASARAIVRTGLAVLLVAIVWLLTTIRPEIDDLSFAAAMAVLGIGMGLLASQLGNVVQSSVGDEERSEVGGLQYTAQNLGSALGTALMGAIVISGLAAALTTDITDDPRVSQAVKEQAGIALEAGVAFVPTADVRAALARSPVPPAEADALVEQYAAAQLTGLKAAVLAAGAITLLGFAFTRGLPSEKTAAHPPAASA